MYYPRGLLAAIRRADEDYKLIEDGDKIAIGVSGGKDSVLLLYLLNKYRVAVEKFKKFEIIGVYINLGFPNMDPSEMINYFKDLNVIIEVIESNTYEILKANKTKKGNLPCSICSKIKKAIAIEAALKNKCNKLAFAHHGDDAIETLLMNAIYGGKLATFKPIMYLDRSDITFIRPMIYIREKEIIDDFKRLQLPLVESKCPSDKYTERENIKILLKKVYELYPSSESNFLLMLHNLDKLDLWKKEKQD